MHRGCHQLAAPLASSQCLLHQDYLVPSGGRGGEGEGGGGGGRGRERRETRSRREIYMSRLNSTPTPPGVVRGERRGGRERGGRGMSNISRMAPANGWRHG